MRLARFIFIVGLISGCSSSQPSTAPTPVSPGAAAPVRVLMLTATAGFRHDSIDTARTVMASLASSSGEFTVTMTEQLSAITGETLSAYHVLFFALTSGELEFSASQKTAIVSFVTSDGGFIGAHSAADILYEWPDYGRLVGTPGRSRSAGDERTTTRWDTLRLPGLIRGSNARSRVPFAGSRGDRRTAIGERRRSGFWVRSRTQNIEPRTPNQEPEPRTRTRNPEPRTQNTELWC